MKNHIPIPAHILGHWTPRNDSVKDAGEKICETLLALSEIDEAWKTWGKSDGSSIGTNSSGMSMFTYLPEFNETQVLITNALLSSRYYAEENREFDHDIGLFFGAVSGTKDDLIDCRSSLLICCCTKGSKRNLNRISLQLPQYGASAVRMNDIELQIKTVRSIIKIWQPEWISVRDEKNISYYPWKFGAFVLGWINYISDSVAKINELPDGWHWKYVDGVRFFCFNRGICSIDTLEDQNSFRNMVSLIQRVCPYPSCMKNDV
jgi:hypothetical protein